MRRHVRKPTRRMIALTLLLGHLALGSFLWGQSETVPTFFVGRLQFGDNQGQDCHDVGMDLVKLVSRASTIHVKEERILKLGDDELFETPFLFMNGHDDFQLSVPA